MILVTLTPDQVLTIALWIIGGFCGVALSLLIYIGNAGSRIKQDVGDMRQLHGERIATLETSQKNTEAGLNRMESKLDQLIMK